MVMTIRSPCRCISPTEEGSLRSGSSSNRNSRNFNSSHGMVEIRKLPSLDWLDIYCFDSYCLFQNFVPSLVQCSRDSRMHVRRISEEEFSFGGLKVTSWYICILQFKQLNMHSCDYQTMYKPLNSESCCLQISMRKTFPQVSTYLYSILTTHSCILLQLKSILIIIMHIFYTYFIYTLQMVVGCCYFQPLVYNIAHQHYSDYTQSAPFFY